MANSQGELALKWKIDAVVVQNFWTIWEAAYKLTGAPAVMLYMYSRNEIRPKVHKVREYQTAHLYVHIQTHACEKTL